MSDEDKQNEQEPSIEEILASIRQIISDEDEEGAPAEEVAEEAAPELEPVVEPEPEPVEEEEEILELTDIVDEEPEPVEEEEEVEIDLVDEDIEPLESGESILTEKAAEATLEGFARLATNIALQRSGQGVTLEDIVKDMLRPMLREWLDAHLPDLIERLVAEELERISRQARD
ncbi:MAG: DUF2497 domain-containing protein [Rhodospirillales bacterium]|nr:DUF2497 domain-containing protein [Rhodospirillales bacterium]